MIIYQFYSQFLNYTKSLKVIKSKSYIQKGTNKINFVTQEQVGDELRRFPVFLKYQQSTGFSNL